jgi:hypothetical protein
VAQQAVEDTTAAVRDLRAESKAWVDELRAGTDALNEAAKARADALKQERPALESQADELGINYGAWGSMNPTSNAKLKKLIEEAEKANAKADATAKNTEATASNTAPSSGGKNATYVFNVNGSSTAITAAPGQEAAFAEMLESLGYTATRSAA